jgi:hypothetical protein
VGAQKMIKLSFLAMVVSFCLIAFCMEKGDEKLKRKIQDIFK